ncbi:uncharacterized protein ACWYII_020242 [Salvelinus alpinus]
MVSDHGPQFSFRFWKAFCILTGLSAILSSGFQPQSNGQSERANQDLETTLRCLGSTNPTTWIQQLAWQEEEVSIPSAQMFVRHCRRTWKRARAALLKTPSRYQRQPDRDWTLFSHYRLGQRVLSPFAVRLLLPRILRIHGRAAGERLFHLRQEKRSAQDFALEFRTLAAGSGWNDRALIDHYRCSLREDVRRELACRDIALSLDELIDMSIRLDTLLAARGRSERVLCVPPPSAPAPIQMELGGAAPRGTGGGGPPCTNCGRRGHTFDRCWGGLSGSRDVRRNASRSPQAGGSWSPAGR